MKLVHLILWAGLLAPVILTARPTPVSVSVLSNDGKFVGSSLGGMQVTIRDTLSNEILATGKTRGSTGDTELIMKETRERDKVLRTEGSARFDASLDLDRPTRVRIEASGPLAQLQSSATVSETRILIPGKDYSQGNGILIHLPGMVVDVLSPPAHLKTAAGTSLEIVANVTKMCGCPVGETTPWPVERYEVEALLYEAGGELIRTIPLKYAGEHSRFVAKVTAEELGAYEVIVTAFDPKTKDSGADSTTFILE
ncbi:MAG: hypothetical protein R6U56_10250 [Opitutales bacterium]